MYIVFAEELVHLYLGQWLLNNSFTWFTDIYQSEAMQYEKEDEEEQEEEEEEEAEEEDHCGRQVMQLLDVKPGQPWCRLYQYKTQHSNTMQPQTKVKQSKTLATTLAECDFR